MRSPPWQSRWFKDICYNSLEIASVLCCKSAGEQFFLLTNWLSRPRQYNWLLRNMGQGHFVLRMDNNGLVRKLKRTRSKQMVAPCKYVYTFAWEGQQCIYVDAEFSFQTETLTNAWLCQKLRKKGWCRGWMVSGESDHHSISRSKSTKNPVHFSHIKIIFSHFHFPSNKSYPLIFHW